MSWTHIIKYGADTLYQIYTIIMNIQMHPTMKVFRLLFWPFIGEISYINEKNKQRNYRLNVLCYINCQHKIVGSNWYFNCVTWNIYMFSGLLDVLRNDLCVLCFCFLLIWGRRSRNWVFEKTTFCPIPIGCVTE